MPAKKTSMQKGAKPAGKATVRPIKTDGAKNYDKSAIIPPLKKK